MDLSWLAIRVSRSIRRVSVDILDIGPIRKENQSSPLWVPSQNGGVCVSLQPQKFTRVDRVALCLIGENAVSLWEPSQKGWVSLRPQLHQK